MSERMSDMTTLTTLGLPSGAFFSDDMTYRYALWRSWGDAEPQVTWVLLNPSTADAVKDDPTIRRCISFTKRWGFEGLWVVNCFGLRSTDPKALRTHPEPVGAKNWEYIRAATAAAQLIVCAWGSPSAIGRSDVPTRMQVRGTPVNGVSYYPIHCLAKNQDGAPRHPLYARGCDLKDLERWP